MVVLLLWGTLGVAEELKSGPQPKGNMSQMGKMTAAQRKAAAQRAAILRNTGSTGQTLSGAMPLFSGFAPAAVTPGTPDYFGTTPNWANSPLPDLDASGNVVPGTGIRKFVDSLPGLTAANANNLGQYLPVAVPDTTTYPGNDYYVIALVQYTEKLHSDLPPTTLRGYVQLNSSGQQVAPPNYLGPVIVSQSNRPTRIKFINQLPTGTAGDLFIPVDTTTMGAGQGPLGASAGNYTQNRADLHLHGGVTPWISDGTPHQWITPAGENTPYPKGVSVTNVPDMPDPGPGATTLFYSNQQSARLMFYHDHSYGITRLNVYAGEAAGYVLRDKFENALINGGSFKDGTNTTVTVSAGTIPADEIPLIIQDKTFVPKPAQLAAEDPTWSWLGYGNLWFPHVYMPNQNPWDLSGANAMGRWDYGPWFWPPYTGLANGPVPNPLYGQPGEPPMNPGTPNPSMVPEAFMDTPLVNGTAYPYTKVGRKAYRLRILNACNDRFLNLSLFYASSNTPDSVNASGAPTLQKASGEVTMVPAVPHSKTDTSWPSTWPTDGRDGGVPAPTSSGPSMIQIGTEGGFLPSATVIPPQPINYVYNRRDIVVLNIKDHALLMGPAERADVIVDFSGVPDGSKLILYSDAPAPVPAFDPRVDYYTDDPDQTDTGGAPTTQAGYGPNTRTVMQFQVNGATAAAPFNLAQLQTGLVAAFGGSQDKPIVAQPFYDANYGKNFSQQYVRIQDTTMSVTGIDATQSVVMQLQPKAIQELFETEYGRMNATLGVELPNTSVRTQTTIPLGYVDPTTETITNSEQGAQLGTLKDGTQIWKITHNGVDTHAIHWHLFNVQLINRVGWDGAVRLPASNEMGWKETVLMNPLEDAIVALRPIAPTNLPFKLPDSIRPMNAATPIGSSAGFGNIDPATGNAFVPPITNQLANYGWEYVWHCHLLGHEENDMMRPIAFQVSPAAPTGLTSSLSGGASLHWTNNATWPSATSFTIQRSTNASFTANLVSFNTPNLTSFVDTTVAGGSYYYRVRAENAVSYSQFSNTTFVVTGSLAKPVTGLRLSGAGRTSLSVRWTLPTGGAARTNIQVQWSTSPTGPWISGPLLSPNATTGNATGLVTKTEYWIRVLVINGAGSVVTGPIQGTTL
jgi:FtsP/CotA-like multicopper oxidase with cupredoxin domain